MPYVDGYVIPIPTDRLAEYTKIAKKAGKIWREHGALDYKECVGDDMNVQWGQTFPKTMKTKPNESVIFAFIVFKSKAHRDKVNAAVMKDPRMNDFGMDPKEMPFNVKKIVYGGFKVLVDA